MDIGILPDFTRWFSGSSPPPSTMYSTVPGPILKWRKGTKNVHMYDISSTCLKEDSQQGFSYLGYVGCWERLKTFFEYSFYVGGANYSMWRVTKGMIEKNYHIVST